MMWRCAVMGVGMMLGLATALPAAPDLNQARTVGGMVLLGDSVAPDLFHMLPLGVTQRTAADGGPELSFAVSRYVGTRLNDDQGQSEIASTLRLGVEIRLPTDAQYALARAELGNDAVLQPLALQRIDAVILTGLDPLPALSTHTEAPAVWNSRDIVLRYAPEQAETLAAVLNTGQAGVSLVWTFYADVVASVDGTGVVTMSGTANTGDAIGLDPRELADLMGAVLADLPADETTRPVAAGALNLQITPAQRAARLIRYDINEVLPPDYPMLTVLCFAFQDTQTTIIERMIEVEATGVLGLTTRETVYFSADRPDQTALPVRFSYAVDLEHPYRWRVIDLLGTGEERASPWQQEPQWTAVLNISRPPT
jgi:hypothetical protein